MTWYFLAAMGVTLVLIYAVAYVGRAAFRTLNRLLNQLRDPPDW